MDEFFSEVISQIVVLKRAMAAKMIPVFCNEFMLLRIRDARNHNLNRTEVKSRIKETSKYFGKLASKVFQLQF